MDMYKANWAKSGEGDGEVLNDDGFYTTHHSDFWSFCDTHQVVGQVVYYIYCCGIEHDF